MATKSVPVRRREKGYSRVLEICLYSAKGERYRDRRTVIKGWKEADRRRDEKLQNTEESKDVGYFWWGVKTSMPLYPETLSRCLSPLTIIFVLLAMAQAMNLSSSGSLDTGSGSFSAIHMAGNLNILSRNLSILTFGSWLGVSWQSLCIHRVFLEIWLIQIYPQ